jgi:NAD-dependent deacetylase
MEFPDELVRHLRAARHIAVLTGAGISAESGIPTFRDKQSGLWANYKPQELASLQGFRDNPALVLEWYAWRRSVVAGAQPNPGHLALAEMEQMVPQFTLITQNVDGLHQRAGSGARSPVIELHGNIHRLICQQQRHDCGGWPDEMEEPPHCSQCGSLLRPDVVWFGELLPLAALQAAQEAAQGCDIFFSIGTSGVVEPAASLPFIALRHHVVTVEVNLEPTPLTDAADFAFQGPSGQILPELVRAAWPERVMHS